MLIFNESFTLLSVFKDPACLSPQIFAERSQEHEKYGGDPDQPHKLHIVTRVKSVMRRPYWEKEMVKHLGLEKVMYLCAEKVVTMEKIVNINGTKRDNEVRVMSLMHISLL